MESIHNEIVFPETHNFSFKGKLYPFKYVLFKYSSKYFLSNDFELESQKDIPLIEPELADLLNFSDQTIQLFIKFVQLEDIQITHDNVCQLNYLAKQYEIPNLLQYTDQYISNNYDEIVLPYLLFNQHKGTSMDHYEDLVSQHLLEYIEDDQFLKLNIPIVYRILKNYYIKQKNNKNQENNDDSKILDFIFKYINAHGKQASILFSLTKFPIEETKYIDLLLDQFQDKIDFQFLNSELAQILRKKIALIDEMKTTLVSKDEIKKLNEENEEMKNEFSMVETFENIITIEAFNKLNLNIQKTLISKYVDNSIGQENELFQKIYDILDYLLKLGEINEEHRVSIESKNNYDFLSNIDQDISLHILHQLTEILYRNNSLESDEFNNLCESFPNLYIDINYPSDLYDDIYQNLEDSKFKKGIILIEDIDTDSQIGKGASYIGFDPSVTSIKGDTYQKKGPFNNCSLLENIIIPPTLIFIGDFVFTGCSSVTQIIIPPSVTSIGSNTFNGCSSLKKIVIPLSVEIIKPKAFFGCSSLLDVELPSSISKIEGYVFGECSSMKYISIPESVTVIEEGAFDGCSSLKAIDLPSTLESINEKAFEKCTSLVYFAFPSSVEEIEPYVFCECTSLKYIEIHSSVTSIGNNAFEGCTSLERIEIPSSMTTIESYAFCKCSSLKKIKIPTSVEHIGSYAFMQCSSLKKFEIPDSIESIESYTFTQCSNLVKIIIPSSIKSICEGAFNECSSFDNIEIPNLVTSIEPYTFRKCTSLKNIKINSSVQSIGEKAFEGCESLTEISIPPSVENIDESAFENCPAQKKI